MKKYLLTNKQYNEITKAINKITTSLIILKTFCEENKDYEKITYVDSLVDKISEKFELIANKF